MAFLKIDTEGYEPHVLAGARELLRKAKPLVFTEFSSWWYIEKGFNPIQFSRVLMDNCDILAIYHGGQKDHLPENDPRGIAILNMLRHGGPMAPATIATAYCCRAKLPAAIATRR